MRKFRNVENWTVYETAAGKAVGMRSVCTDGEWQALELSHPGFNVLIRTGIASEADAEKLARGTAGDTVAKRSARTATAATSVLNPAVIAPL